MDKKNKQQIVEIKEAQFLVLLPEGEGRVIVMCNFRGQLVITTEKGRIYIWNHDEKTLNCTTWLRGW